jgi:hypothetical protein
MITADRIKHLYDRYLELIRLEIDEFGVKPTEVRHLIGRLGEFYCALQVNGTLAHLANRKRPATTPSHSPTNPLHYAPETTGAKRWARRSRVLM